MRAAVGVSWGRERARAIGRDWGPAGVLRERVVASIPWRSIWRDWKSAVVRVQVAAKDEGERRKDERKRAGRRRVRIEDGFRGFEFIGLVPSGVRGRDCLGQKYSESGCERMARGFESLGLDEEELG